MGWWRRIWNGLLRRSPDTDALRDSHPDAASRQRAVAAVQELLGHRFEDPDLLEQALVHRSYLHTLGADRLGSNERLEFLGDGVLGMVANEYLYREYPEHEEGDLTRMKSRLVCGASLSRVAKRLRLGDHVLMSRGEAATGGRKRDSILADTVEAVIGAVFLDGGFDAARAAIEKWLLDDADGLLDTHTLVNDKSRLQELVQASHKTPPHYRVLETKGPDHERIFTVEVYLGNTVLGRGRGASKKNAEQQAAGDALLRLKQEPDLLETIPEPPPHRRR